MEQGLILVWWSTSVMIVALLMEIRLLMRFWDVMLVMN
jgi:hypothetical protein